mmetsp:Transcript_26403/g.26653  ORF Transcript_26403/g.26653 Transcript_26403/m.26653 type:complete len:140 (-) Transcript_26403:23-442(-)
MIRIQEMFSSFPPDMHRFVKGLRGPVLGVWTVPHPLQLHPYSYHEALSAIQEAGLGDAKKQEWELDLLREYDEKRMDRFESFLISCRENIGSENKKKNYINDKMKLPPSTANSKKRDEEKEKYNKNDYYKDRGRQPHKY